MKSIKVSFEAVVCAALAIVTVTTIGVLMHAVFSMRLVA